MYIYVYIIICNNILYTYLVSHKINDFNVKNIAQITAPHKICEPYI